MKNKTKGSGGKIIKGMTVGIALGTALTMLSTNYGKASKKIKNASNNVTESISNMMNFK